MADSSGKLVLHDLAPSPNNIKVRLALGYKNLAFEKVTVPFDDRSTVLQISRQPLTPVLLHGKTVVYDSYAILRYLEANFAESPRLFSENRETMHAIEEQELLTRTELSPSVHMIFQQFLGGTADEKVFQEASSRLHAFTGQLEQRLQEGQWILGNSLTAADLTLAPFVSYGMLTRNQAEGNELAQFFLDHLDLGSDRTRTRDWVQRVMAYDR